MADFQERTDSKGKVTITARIRIRGHKPVVETFRTLTEARKWAQRKESDIRRGIQLPDLEAKRRTLGDAIDRYVESVLPHKSQSTQHGQGIQLAHWRSRIGHVTLSAITPATIADERDHLLRGTTTRKTTGKLDRATRTRKKGAELPEGTESQQRSPATVVRYLSVLSHCLEFTRRELGWIETNPARSVSKPKEPRGRVRILTDEEKTALLEACRASRNPHLSDVVSLLLSTAARRNEIGHLRWEHVDFKRRAIVLEETKNGDRRVIPLRGEAERILIARSKIRRIDTPYVFPAPAKRGKIAGPANLQSAWDWAVERAKIADFRMHDLRHTAASTLAMNGATLAELAEVLGHRTLQMVKRYSHFTEGHTGHLMERLDSAMFAKPTKAKRKS